MKITDHLLYRPDDTPIPFRMSPNHGEEYIPKLIVIHYTAGPSLVQAVDWLSNPQSKASAHVVIGRDGTIAQIVPFNRIAWHAGVSEWNGMRNLNQYAIGIELENAGRLTQHGERWRAWFGQEYTQEDVLVANHKNENTSSGWHLYTPTQIQVTMEVCLCLAQAYNITDIIGHDDISPGRKSDPGPAFPMGSFQSRLTGRLEEDINLYSAKTHLNVRMGPGAHYGTIEGSPIPPGTKVEIIQSEGSWRFVDVLDSVNGINDLQGWVHGRYLDRLENA